MIAAHTIVQLLANKHDKDLFVPECKDGPTQWGSHLRLDAWAMKRSWSNPRSIGYEIKVSRSDFVQDNKLESYMQYCHQFYIVAPSGVVSKDELPEGAGLMVPSTNGTRLFTKVKAPYRDIEWPIDLLRYILLARVGNVSNDFSGRFGRDSNWNAAYWREWLKKKEINRELGYRVSKALREEIDKKIDAVERKQKLLERRIETLSAMQAYADQHGIRVVSHDGYFAVKDMARIKAEEDNGFTRGFKIQVNDAINALQKIADRIEGAR